MIRGKTFKAHDITAIQKEIKTQFRVVVKNLGPDEEPDGGPDWFYPTVIHRGEETPGKRTFGIWGEDWHIKCPYAVGDVLYAKETWGIHQGITKLASLPLYEYETADIPRDSSEQVRIDAWARGDLRLERGYSLVYKATDTLGLTGKWRSPMHLPQWVARFWLEITEVRCERLNDISEEDAIAEGAACSRCRGRGWYLGRFADNHATPCQDCLNAAREKGTFIPPGQYAKQNIIRTFQDLWDSIAKPQHNWAANPWVFVYKFKRVEKP